MPDMASKSWLDQLTAKDDELTPMEREALGRIEIPANIMPEGDVGSKDHIHEQVAHANREEIYENPGYESTIIRAGGSASTACKRCGAMVQVADRGLHDEFHKQLRGESTW